MSGGRFQGFHGCSDRWWAYVNSNRRNARGWQFSVNNRAPWGPAESRTLRHSQISNKGKYPWYSWEIYTLRYPTPPNSSLPTGLTKVNLIGHHSSFRKSLSKLIGSLSVIHAAIKGTNTASRILSGTSLHNIGILSATRELISSYSQFIWS